MIFYAIVKLNNFYKWAEKIITIVTTTTTAAAIKFQKSVDLVGVIVG